MHHFNLTLWAHSDLTAAEVAISNHHIPACTATAALYFTISLFKHHRHIPKKTCVVFVQRFWKYTRLTFIIFLTNGRMSETKEKKYPQNLLRHHHHLKTKKLQWCTYSDFALSPAGLIETFMFSFHAQTCESQHITYVSHDESGCFILQHVYIHINAFYNKLWDLLI